MGQNTPDISIRSDECVVFPVLLKFTRFLIGIKPIHFHQICLPKAKHLRRYKYSKSFANNNTLVGSCSYMTQKSRGLHKCTALYLIDCGEMSANSKNYFFSLRISRISVRRTSSLLGAGGAGAGAGLASSFLRSLFITFTIINTQSARIVKSTTC